ncbi:hypothetical protein [Brevibacillus agri]|uniref:hypothetical protein n=1 Tax=Brevibacillus agri TaxID=51101 RepID=UPI003D1EDF7C
MAARVAGCHRERFGGDNGGAVCGLAVSSTGSRRDGFVFSARCRRPDHARGYRSECARLCHWLYTYATATPLFWQAAFLCGFVALQVAAEFVSFSQVIEQKAWLKRLDEWGR